MGKVDESRDLDLVERLIFTPRGLVLTPFTQLQLLTGRTPDFQVLKDGRHVAYCEVKSPRDDWLDEQIGAAPPGMIAGGGRDDPTFNRLARHIQKASSQFDAVDPNRAFPAILAIVNHDKQSGFLDLLETITGKLFCEGGYTMPTMMHIARDRLRGAQHRIDLYVMINEHSPRVESYLFTQSDAGHLRTLCELMGVDEAGIQQLN